MDQNGKTVKTKQTLPVVDSRKLASGVWSLVLQYPEGSAPQEVRPGQFVGIYPADAARLLPRPISICEWDGGSRRLRLVYRVVGGGTAEFSALRPGEKVDVLGILGNGYDVSLLTGKRVLLLGGGIGAPPMLGLAEAIARSNAGSSGGRGSITAVMGYRTDDLFLTEEFRQVSHLVIATDDGSAGFHGNAVEAAVFEADHGDISGNGVSESAPAGGGNLNGQQAPFDVICACGPLPMLRGVKHLAGKWGVPAWLSLEERMACGVGACLGCVVKTTDVDGHSHVHNARVCTEGPVFRAEEVEIG